jgi:hypothetical protein
MLCADLVDVRWRERSGRNRRVVANLEDISLSGVCLQLEKPIPMGAFVRISYPKGEFSGVVRYCMYKEIGYFAGIQFEVGCRWSKTSFKPLHLLDPRTLVKKVPHRVKAGVPAPPRP